MMPEVIAQITLVNIDYVYFQLAYGISIATTSYVGIEMGKNRVPEAKAYIHIYSQLCFNVNSACDNNFDFHSYSCCYIQRKNNKIICSGCRSRKKYSQSVLFADNLLDHRWYYILNNSSLLNCFNRDCEGNQSRRVCCILYDICHFDIRLNLQHLSSFRKIIWIAWYLGGHVFCYVYLRYTSNRINNNN